LQSDGTVLDLSDFRQVENLPYAMSIQVKRGLQCPALLVVKRFMQQEN
jgi:hypothetical protein